MGNKSSSNTSSSSEIQNVFNLSEETRLKSIDGYTIRNCQNGDEFKVRRAGIHFTLLGVHTSSSMFHFGLLCDDNEFIEPCGRSYKMVLMHRLKSGIQLVFSNNAGELYNCLRYPLGDKARTSKISKIPIGKRIKVASEYAKIFNGELSKEYNVKFTDAEIESNCMAFIVRMVKHLDLKGSFPSSTSLKKTLDADGWVDESLSNKIAMLFSVFLGQSINTRDAIEAINIVYRNENANSRNIQGKLNKLRIG